MKPSDFVVDAVMVHDVPEKKHQQAVVLTDTPIALDDDLRDYFSGKIVASLGFRGLEVVADSNADPTVRAAVARIGADPLVLAAESQTIARRLDHIQDARNPAGLLAVVSGRVADQACVAILKLEREEGLRVRVRLVDGRRTIDMEHLRDLTLTDKTKVFKTAILVTSAPDRPDLVVGRASDDQRSLIEGDGVANFFLAKFLGCKLKVNPAIATRAFFEAVETFINEDVASPEKRAKYHLELLQALEGPVLDVQPRRFAERSVESNDQPALLANVAARGLDLDSTFARDIGLIERRLRGFKLVFESGIVVVGGAEDLRDRIELRDNDSRNPGADINDTIRRLQGR